MWHTCATELHNGWTLRLSGICEWVANGVKAGVKAWSYESVVWDNHR